VVGSAHWAETSPTEARRSRPVETRLRSLLKNFMVMVGGAEEMR
jgi:hypothetical protein